MVDPKRQAWTLGGDLVELIGTEDPRWHRLLESTQADDYQLPGWAQLSGLCERGRPFGLYGRLAGGEFLVPMVLRELPDLGDPELANWRDAISPYGYPGALVRGSFGSELEHLGKSIREVLKAHRILTCFIRMNPMRADANPILERLGAVVEGGETVYYDLQLDEAALWSGVRRDHRKDVEVLLRAGYTTRVDDWADLEDFKRLYRRRMETVQARDFYMFDDAYFERMREVLGDRLHLVSVLDPQGGIVSAGLFVTGGDGTVHSHLTGTCNSRVEASKLMYDAAWRWLKGRGFRALHLGGGLSRPNDTLLMFKRGLAKGRKVFRSARLVSDPGLYRLACGATGTDAEDLGGFFPAYRRITPDLDGASRGGNPGLPAPAWS
jgi:hypothetical protein